jgi:hypothetical protein
LTPAIDTFSFADKTDTPQLRAAIGGLSAEG